jgi:hypothetical protein
MDTQVKAHFKSVMIKRLQVGFVLNQFHQNLSIFYLHNTLMPYRIWLAQKWMQK